MTDRLRTALESVVLSVLPELRYLGVWDYTVVSATAGTPVTIEATSNDPVMPPISGVPLRPGPDGGTAVPLPGAVVSVAFANPFNPKTRRPYVVSLDPSALPGSATIDATLLVAIGPTAAITKIGKVPLPLASGPATVTAVSAIGASAAAAAPATSNNALAWTALATAMAALATDPALTTGAAPCAAAATPCTTAAGTASAASAPALAAAAAAVAAATAIPTTTVLGGP